MNHTAKPAALAAFLLLALPVTAKADDLLAQTSIWTLQDENASIATNLPEDRYYVNGFHIGWTSPQGFVPDAVAGLGHALLGDGVQRISLGLIQQIYTPNNTLATNPPINDEPYAGYLVANLALIQDSANARSVLGVNVGVIGAGAGAKFVQNGFHAVIGQGGTHGWAYQLPTGPALDFLAARTWRIPLAQFGALQTDALPQISGMAGLTADYVQPAIGLRLGQGLGDDFGPPMLAPSGAGGDAYAQTSPLDWYVFASAGVKLVGYDEVLQGSPFQSSRHVNPSRFVGSGEIGGVIIWRKLRFSFTETFQSSRFHGQGGDLHEFGSFAISGSF